MNYDFKQLNPREFESFVVDLLSSVLKKRIERFKIGKDKGVDGRFFTDEKDEVIIQIKHYVGSGYKTFLKELKKELEKVKKLNSSRYILATSLPLSRDKKNEIKKLFEPYIHTPTDIFGQEDLNDILSRNPDIEEKHYKLWLTSTAILKRLLNNAISGRSEYELEAIRRKSFMYVHTKNHEEAIKILTENKVVIITGEPGIGKTTLAENLCLYYVAKGYQFVSIQEELGEAENIFEPDKKQLFYYDDFLGTTYLEGLENKKDSHIVKFIERVKNTNNKLFILTSRTNILLAGVTYSSIFTTSKIQKSEYLVKITDLSEEDKAKILYNHIWFSNLDESFIDEIYKDKRYKNIIRHKNFNPRIIEFITDKDKITNTTALKYWEYVENTLDNPKDVWNDPFKNQVNAFVRNLVFLTIFNYGSIFENELKKSYRILNKLEELKNNSSTEKDFESMTQIAVKTFLTRSIRSDSTIFTPFNPSVIDYIIAEYVDDTGLIINIMKALTSKISIKYLSTLIAADKIYEKEVIRIMKSLVEYVLREDVDVDYKVHILSWSFKELESYKHQILKSLKDIITHYKGILDLADFINLIEEFIEEFDDIDGIADFISNIADRKSLEESEVTAIGDFLGNNKINHSRLESILIEECETAIEADLDQAKDELNFDKLITKNSYFNGIDWDSDIEYDEKEIEAELISSAEAVIRNYNSDYISNLDIDIDSLVGLIDINTLVENYLSNYEYEPDDYYERGSHPNNNVNLIDPIDDIFDRS